MQYSEQGIVTASHNVDGISLSSAAALVKLDATHIAIYAADSSDEGALLLLFDLKFGMTVATRRLKVFCNPPMLHCSSANKVLLLCVVQNLVVVPYILQPSLLWNLIGQNQVAELKSQPQVVSWSGSGSATEAVQRSRPKNPLKFRKSEIDQLAESLWQSDASFCRLFDELLPLLKDDKDLDGICLLLSHVRDLPEKWQADLLNFFLRQSNDQLDSIYDDEQQSQRLALLLSIPYSDVVLLTHLRKTLTTSCTLKLLRYLAALLQERQWLQQEENGDDDQFPKIDRIVDWISLVLDAHHNELLVASADVQVQSLIQQLNRMVTERYEFLDCLGQSEALIQLLQRKKKPPTNRRKDWYAIEVVRLL